VIKFDHENNRYLYPDTCIKMTLHFLISMTSYIFVLCFEPSIFFSLAELWLLNLETPSFFLYTYFVWRGWVQKFICHTFGTLLYHNNKCQNNFKFCFNPFAELWQIEYDIWIAMYGLYFMKPGCSSDLWVFTHNYCTEDLMIWGW
jgi:hypothetical protein